MFRLIPLICIRANGLSLIADIRFTDANAARPAGQGYCFMKLENIGGASSEEIQPFFSCQTISSDHVRVLSLPECSNYNHV